MGKQIQKNKNSILRFLYHNRGAFKRRKEIENGTGLTKTQIQYALDDITALVERKESETKGGIQDAYVYSINKKGRAYIENEIDKIPQEQQNREEIERIEKEIISLNAKICQYKRKLEEWRQYTEKHSEVTENRIRDIEDELMND